MSDLVALIQEKASIDAIATYLNGKTGAEREQEVNGLRRQSQASLFEMAADSPRIRLSHFVPEGTGELKAVHHPGRNTIATFAHFQRFEKRFARQPGSTDRVIGYNASNAFFVTPGYFVAYETDAEFVGDKTAEWSSRGGVVVDYHQVPEVGSPVPEGWPAIIPNSQGIQRLVYHNTRDFMRAVSPHVSVGRASVEDAKGDRILDYWFTLVRQESS